MKSSNFFAVVCMLAVLAVPLSAQPKSTGVAVYQSGYARIAQLGNDLYCALGATERSQIRPQPVSLETDVAPWVRLLIYPNERMPGRGVWISVGFVDLVSNVARAKAIDSRKRGYFKRYVEMLSFESGNQALQPLPNDGNPAYWTETILNEQLSNFNSIVATILGIQLAHHYLGQYDKYKDRLVDAQGNKVPINNLLTPAEWETALNCGVQNALEAGYAIEGVLPFFEAFEKMKARPAWSAYFLPEHVRFSKLKKEMEKIQHKFFSTE